MLPPGTIDAVLLLALTGPGPDLAVQTPAPWRSPAPERRFTLDTINDGFATWYDEGYSSGVRVLARGGPPIDALALGRALGPGLRRRLVAEYWTGGIAHDIWTPTDLTADEVRFLEGDRPYAGLLSGELSTDLVFRGALTTGGYTRVSAKLMAGVTGKWSLSQPIQKRVHSVLRVFTGAEYPIDPQGWGIYEVPETVLVNLRFGVETEVLRVRAPSGWSGLTHAPLGARATARSDCDLGTFRVGCEIGTMVRMGWMPELTLDGATPIVEGEEAALPLNGHVFAGTRMGVVLFDALLDGPIGTDGPTANRRLVRARLEFGFLVQLWDVEASYTYIVETNEQSPLPEYALSFQRMGQVKLSYRY
ncbi:MAG: lipid A deacylase LpxR family protein [Deltaproteobacteria bacterium]|nr:lipid A deacylase LpxR family protein [Deltaproteobacteria bacterium]